MNEAVYLIIPPDNPEMFTAVTEVIGRPELQKDERFATPPARARNAAAHEVMKALASRGVVCGAVLDTAEVLANPHLRERGAVYDIDHPTRGRFSVIGCPVRLSDSPFSPTRAPLMGEHTETILTSLAGFTADEVRALRKKRVI